MSGVHTPLPIKLLGNLLDVNINPTTLNAGDILQYNATTTLWDNAAGGGGGGVSITGSTDAAVFRTAAGNGIAEGDGIFKNVGTAGYTMNLDRSNKRVGVNTATPVTTLDIGGNAQVVGTDTIKLENDTLGIITGAGDLKLYSGNAPAVADGLTTINSVDKKTGSSAFRSYDPATFDLANSTDENSVYKIQLRTGTLRQAVATPAFDIQEAFRPQAFPTGQIVEYQNKVPIQKPIIISRNLGPQTILPATTRVVTSFGLRRNAPFFDDGMTYDPCNMRAKLSGLGWNSAGAPVVYRARDVKLGFTISWNIHGTWAGAGNRCDVYVVQYRNGAILYNHLVQQLEQDREVWCIGKKTFLGWDVIGEDFDPTTDYYEVEFANMSGTGTNLTYNSALVEIECWLAQ